MRSRFEDFVSGITVCYKFIQRIKSAEMTELGLKGTHVMCLYYLNHSEGTMTAAELCRLCSEDKAAISRTVATLRERGYIAPSEKRYRSELRLTDEGRAVAERVDGLIEQWVGAGSDGLSEADRAAFYRSLALISRNLARRLETK